MTEIVSRVKEFHGYLCTDIDPRVKDWLFMSDPLPSTLLIIIYLLFVYFGPKWMEKRKAISLNNVLIIYNFSMVILCGYIIYEFSVSGMLTGYSLGCQPVDYSNSPKAIRMARATWMFFIAKFIELLDTVFFILRKKNNQVTFLHVFHHGCLPLFWWWGVTTAPGGFGVFHPYVNCFVHVVMYFYYGVAALGPKYQKYLWWKRYVTVFQLSQFFIVTLHNSQYLFIECSYPWTYVVFIQSFTTIIALMFLNFYIKTYKLKKAATKLNDAKKYDEITSNGNHANGDVIANGNGIITNGYSHSETRDLRHKKIHV